jgi:DNA-binding protein YbaB
MLAALGAAALAIGVAQAPGAGSEEAAALQPRVENTPADKSYPVNCGHACQAKMARAKEQRMGGNKVGRAVKGMVNLFAPSSLEHPPHFHIDGKETRLFLKSGAETPLLTFPTSGGMLSLVGSTTGRDVDEWFESFSLVTDNSKAAVNIQAGKPLSAAMPTKTLGVRVDGEPLPHAGLQASHRAMGVAVMARALPDKSEDGEAVEEVTIWSPEFELTVTSDNHSTGRHLNMKMNALPPGATGLLAELAGAQPISLRAKNAQIAPETAERTTGSVQSKAEQADEAMQDAEAKVEEAQKAIRKAHLKGAEAKEAASFDETVLANRAQEGRLALKNATKFRRRRHARKVAARIVAANGGQPAKMPKFGPEGRTDDFPNEPYAANLSKTVDFKQMQAKRAAKKAQRKLKQKMQEEAKAAHEEAQAEENEKKAGAAVEAHFAGKASKKKAHLMKELPSPSPMPAVITTDPVGDAAAAAAASQGEKSLPGCHSIALISDSWCTNNCLMGNCPKDMCSDECFADPVVEELRSNETSKVVRVIG